MCLISNTTKSNAEKRNFKQVSSSPSNLVYHWHVFMNWEKGDTSHECLHPEHSVLIFGVSRGFIFFRNKLIATLKKILEIGSYLWGKTEIRDLLMKGNYWVCSHELWPPTWLLVQLVGLPLTLCYFKFFDWHAHFLLYLIPCVWRVILEILSLGNEKEDGVGIGGKWEKVQILIVSLEGGNWVYLSF